jgi:hypothetical protein
MTLPLIIAGAVLLALFALAGLRLRAVRWRRRLPPPVTEADAKAHSMPLTRSVLSVTQSSGDRVARDA